MCTLADFSLKNTSSQHCNPQAESGRGVGGYFQQNLQRWEGVGDTRCGWVMQVSVCDSVDAQRGGFYPEETIISSNIDINFYLITPLKKKGF